MRSCRSLIAPLTIVAAVVVAPHTLAAQSANAPPRPMSTAVREYLDAALDTLQRVSRHRDTFDWSALRDSVRVRAAGAQSIQDALPTLGWALRHVDRHSFLQPAAATPPAVSGRLVDERLGYILVPWFPGASRPTYIDSLQTMIRDFDTRGACGWIVDLRGNQGGNMWPMLAGIGPLLGDSIVGAFSIHGDLQPWFYVDGASWYVESGNRTGETKGSLPAHRPRERYAPVAVLSDRRTASSGEATLIAFRGRPNLRTFGDTTAGGASVNRGIRLSDGSTMVVTIGLERDRTGFEYPLRIPPDEFVASDGTQETDAVLDRARAWLAGQPPCRR